MTFARHALLAAAFLTAAISGCKSDESKDAAPQAEQTLSVKESANVSVTAKVKAIDYTSRRITLEDASGHSAVFIAGDAIQRLNEVKVGDSVKAEYSVSLLAERRAPTADERENPIAMVAIAGRTPQGDTPAGGAAMATRVVTTVQAIDLPNMRVTLMGPMGDSTTFHAKNPDNVKKLKIGDTIVITYTEAMGLSLVKVPNK